MTILLYHINGFLNRSSIKMTFENIKYWNPPQLNLSENFQMVVMMKYGNANVIRNDIINISMDYLQFDLKKKNFTISKLPLIQCNPEHFNKAVQQYESLELSKGLCTDLKNITIEGSTVNDYLSYVRINFIFCDNKTNICLSNEAASEYMSKMKPQAVLFFLDTTYHISNYPNIESKFINSVSVNVTWSNTKSVDLFFQYNPISIQNGYIIDSTPTVIKNFMYESMVSQVSVRSKDEYSSLYMNILSSKSQTNIYISFLIFSELLANIAGFVNNIIIFSQLLVYYTNNSIFQIDFFNKQINMNNNKNNVNKKKIFKKVFHDIHNSLQSKTGNNDLNTDQLNLKSSINDTNLNKFEINDSVTKIKNDKMGEIISFRKPKLISSSGQIQTKNILSLITTELREKHPFTHYKKPGEKINEIMEEEKSKQSMGFQPRDLLIIMCCSPCKNCSVKLKNKFIIYEKMNDYLNFYQDYSRIFSKLNEIDILKYILLDKDQDNIFKILSKPEFVLSSKENKDNELNKSFKLFYNKDDKSTEMSKIELKEQNEVMSSIQNLLIKQNSTEVDYKLIKKFIEAFEKEIL